jgi:hypothetical protein
MTRSGLIRLLGISAAKLDRMLELCLPIRSDGDFNFDHVLRWTAAHGDQVLADERVTTVRLDQVSNPPPTSLDARPSPRTTSRLRAR